MASSGGRSHRCRAPNARRHRSPRNAPAKLPPGERSSELELVELLLASGRQRGAAEALARHIDNTSPDSIQPWKKLVDLYRRCNMRAEFEALRPRILEKFKIHLPDWDRPQVS